MASSQEIKTRTWKGKSEEGYSWTGHLALPDEILTQVEKPARYIGGEVNAVIKDASRVDIRFAGFANWIQDWQYLECPECGRPMKYAAQIEWDMLFDEYGGEGTLYLEICPDCHIAGLLHQQT